jgi:hypothetical protein
LPIVFARDFGTSQCAICEKVFEVTASTRVIDPKAAAESVVRFLRGLLFDGELSGDEVWCLANWLNKQPKEVCNQWPADVLIPLLQNVFADGELTHLEMLQVATALVQVETEWTDRFATPENLDDESPSAATTIAQGKRGTPLLPTVDYVSDVPSTSGDAEYRVNLVNHTCTCGDWVVSRRSTPVRDYKRLCKHMARTYHALEIADETNDPMFGAFIVDHVCRDRGTFPGDEWIVENLNGKAVLYGISATSPWVNIFAPQGGDYERFGFNREEKRWSYGESPRGYARLFRDKFRA